MVLLSGKELWNKNPKCEHAIIGAGGFVLESVTVNAETNEINLAIRPTKREQCQRSNWISDNLRSCFPRFMWGKRHVNADLKL